MPKLFYITNSLTSKYFPIYAMQTSNPTDIQLMFFQEVFPVSPSPKQANKKVRKMKGIYGQRCEELLTKFAPSSSLAKTLVMSILLKEDWYLTKSVPIWDAWVTPSKHLVFQLRPLPHPKSECELTSSLLPTLTVCGNRNRKGLTEKSSDGVATMIEKLPTLLPTVTKGGNGGVPSSDILVTKNKTVRRFNPRHGQSNAGLAGTINFLPNLLPTLLHRVNLGAIMSPNQNSTSDTLKLIGLKLSATFAEFMMGVPERLDKGAKILSKTARIGLMGNAIVPQIARHFFEVIKNYLKS
jgi:hypothetical protein